jgi:adenine-specific DNA-methyltransferase
MQINADKNKNYKFIMIQFPEDLDGSKERKVKNKVAIDFCDDNDFSRNVSEIGKERIRRAGEKIKEDNADKEGVDDLDIGFRVLKVDSSNMKDVYFSPDNTSQDDMIDLASNIKDNRTDEDLLFMVLLDWGIDLSVKIERREVAGETVYFADDNFLAACFEDNLDEDFIKALAAESPLKVVLRDSGFASSSVKINAGQIFKQADIEVKVI